MNQFWLKTLDRLRTVHMQPLPCPFGVDISCLPLEELRKLAIHGYSLKRNWSSALAIPVSLRTLTLGEEYHNIFPIPGTNLVLTMSLDRLACWHTKTGACLGALEPADEEEYYLGGRSSPFQLPGQCFIALSSQRG
jgi:hypothetical protein